MEITNYIRPEFLCLIPMLWVLGRLLKSAPFFSDRLIPLALGVVGSLTAVCYAIGEEGMNDAAGIVTAAVQGILCAGTAVYGHQMVKQLGGKTKGAEESDE
ncbi:MAG: phage holin family protein [Clostridia bacterium]|nr:phage holin family protein [Clostridia bacterium]